MEQKVELDPKGKMELRNEYLAHIQYSEDGQYSCEESGCDDDGICRCYTLNEVHINYVDLVGITNEIYDQIFPKNTNNTRDIKLTEILFDYNPEMIDKLCINRILTHHKFYSEDNWTAKWSSGYYGDEFDGIYMNYKYAHLKSDLEKLFKLNSIRDKIEFILNLEYGYVLDELKDKEYKLQSIDVESIDFSQRQHLTKVQSKDLDFYSDTKYRDLPRGVVLWKNNKWRVIDGYHRLSSTKFPKVRVITIK